MNKIILFAGTIVLLFLISFKTEACNLCDDICQDSFSKNIEIPFSIFPKPPILVTEGCADFLNNLSATGVVPDPLTEYVESPPEGFGCGTGTAYPSPLNPGEQTATFTDQTLCGGSAPLYRGLDESYAVVVGGDYVVPDGGGAESEGRALIGGDLIVDKLYALSESGGGTFVIGAPGDAIVVGGSVSGSGTLSSGANNTSGTYNIVSGGTNTVAINNGNPIENSATLPADASEMLAQGACASTGMKDGTVTGTADFAFGAGTFTGTNAPVEVFNISGADLDPGFQGTASFADNTIAPDATIIINVSGTNVTLNHALLAGRINDPNNTTGDTDAVVHNVIWNFYEATDLTIASAANGTILAPLANITVDNNINGRVYAGGNLTHSGSGTEIHNYSFIGDLSAFCTTTTPSCAITATSMAQTCNDNGTPDEADDYFTIDVDASTTGTGSQFEVMYNGSSLGTSAYGTPLTVGSGQEFLSDGSTTYTIEVRDATETTCTTSFTTTAEASCSITGSNSSARLGKTVNNSLSGINEQVTFTLVVYNNGEGDVTGLEVTDLLPIGLDYVSDNSGGNYDETTGLWNVGTILVGDSATIEITTLVTETGVLINQAEITRMDQIDVNSTPNNGVITEDDMARACVSAVIEVCDNETISYSIEAETGYTNYQWYKDGVLIDGETNETYIATEVGAYTYTVDGVGPGDCQGELCCPVVIQQVSCCAPVQCLPIVVTKK